jgi:hypothetical protein
MELVLEKERVQADFWAEKLNDARAGYDSCILVMNSTT